MSTKTSKKQRVSQGRETPQPSTSTPISKRPSSPLSPTRYSRLQEKQDLANLNDRLACYIDKVRYLETENSQLSREIQSSQEIVTREVSNIKAIYEHELSDAKKLLDDTARERAKLEIDTKRLWDNSEDLKNKLDKKTKDLQVAERNLLIYENRCTELQTQYNQTVAEKKKGAQREKELEKELERTNLLLDDARKNLEEETLQRIDLENHVQSLKEDIAFKDQVFQQELTETRSRRQVEISEIDGRLSEKYEAKLQQSLQELRGQYEAQMRVNREEIEGLYENKMKNLTTQVQRNSGAASAAMDDLRQTRARNEVLNQRITELETSTNDLNNKLRDLENLRASERARHSDDQSVMEAEITRLRDEMSRQLQEYQDLMDIRIALDLEIAAYRKLLESEEARLNITPMHSPDVPSRSTPSRATPIRSGKRKRTLLEESEERSSSNYSITGSTKGDVEISETDSEGRYVKLTNKGNQEISLSGWQLLRKAGALETVFKFHRTTKIEGGANVFVWSSDIGAAHEPPSNIVMKGQKWFIADNMTTTLSNNEGEEMATSERKKQQVSTSMSRHRDYGFRSPDELHYQQDDPKSNERCQIM